MEPEAAQVIAYAITAVGGIVWLSSLWFLIRTAQAGKAPKSPLAEQPAWAEQPGPHMVVGGAEVGGRPADLAAKVAAVLATSSGLPFGPIKVLEQRDDRVVFERAQAMGPGFRRGQIRFTPAGSNRTAVTYAVEGGRWMLWASSLCQALGLAALVAGFWLVQIYVVSSPQPTVRWQVFQGFQVVHFLWPPFLFAGLHRKLLRMVRSHFDTLIHNLPFHSSDEPRG